MYEDVMLDIETLGRRPGCVVLSIGAVAFNSEGVAPNGFYCEIDKASCVERGMRTDPETIKWWESQSPKAKAVLDPNNPNAVPVNIALTMFAGWLSSFGKDVRVWGNGASFDNAILGEAYEICGLKTPWKYSNNRCYRTLRALLPDINDCAAALGVPHNAIDDARYQAQHAVMRMRELERSC